MRSAFKSAGPLRTGRAGRTCLTTPASPCPRPLGRPANAPAITDKPPRSPPIAPCQISKVIVRAAARPHEACKEFGVIGWAATGKRVSASACKVFFDVARTRDGHRTSKWCLVCIFSSQNKIFSSQNKMWRRPPSLPRRKRGLLNLPDRKCYARVRRLRQKGLSVLRWLAPCACCAHVYLIPKFHFFMPEK